MAEQVERTVRFFEASVRDQDGQRVEQRSGVTVFDSAHAYAMDDAEGRYRQIRRNGVDYTGWADVAAVSISDFLLIGKVRRSADNPGVTAFGGPPTPLELGRGRLVEPTYVVPVPGTPYIATLGTSSGPRSGAVAEWLTHVGRYADSNLMIELLPVLRRDAFDRLQQATAATGFTVRLPANAEPGRLGHLGRMFDAARGFASDEGVLTVSFSLGRHKAGRDSETDLLDIVDEVARASEVPGAKHASANLRIPGSTGEQTRAVDFIADKLTTKVKLVVEDGAPLSHEAVVSRLVEAIGEARPHLPR